MSIGIELCDILNIESCIDFPRRHVARDSVTGDDWCATQRKHHRRGTSRQRHATSTACECVYCSTLVDRTLPVTEACRLMFATLRCWQARRQSRVTEMVTPQKKNAKNGSQIISSVQTFVTDCSPLEYCYNIWCGKTRMVWLPER